MQPDRPALSPGAPAQSPASTDAAAHDDGLPVIEAGDLASLWRHLEALAEQRSALAWLTNLEPVAWEGNAVTLRARPGCDSVLRFTTTDRLKAMADYVAGLIRQPLTINVQSSTGSQPADPQRAATNKPDMQDAREAALQLPLVRQIIDTFDNVSIIDSQPQRDAGRPTDEDQDEDPAATN